MEINYNFNDAGNHFAFNLIWLKRLLLGHFDIIVSDKFAELFSGKSIHLSLRQFDCSFLNYFW